MKNYQRAYMEKMSTVTRARESIGHPVNIRALKSYTSRGCVLY